jgi:uncharacterized protein (TIGR03437 family)
MKAAVTFALAVCALASASDLKTGVWRGIDVVYREIDGVPVAQGDIVLDDVDVDTGAADRKGRRDAVGRNDARFLWPEGVVPYAIDGDLPNQTRVTAAVEHWNTHTPVRLVPRTIEAAYVRFRKHASACSSNVGRIGREQFINLADNCSTGAVIHEIGHAVGLFHEQSRTDRDFHLRMIEDNVDKRELNNFTQVLTTGEDIGGYDYASIMHYSIGAFSRNGKPVLQTIPAGIPIGQVERLSPGDIEAVRAMYGAPSDSTVITSFPFGLELEIDGQRVSTPYTVRWAPGSVHSVAAVGPQMSGAYRYSFARWSDGGSQSHVVVASPDNRVLTASFIRQYRMPLGVTPASAGRLEINPPPDDGWLTDGTEVEIRPVANDGWTFVQWSGFGSFGTHGLSPSPLRVIVRGPETNYTANFTQSPVTTITSEPPGLRVVVDGETVTTPRSYRWTAGSTHTVNIATTTQTAGNETVRYLWEGWSDDGEQSHTVTASGESQTIAARFRTQHLVTRGTASGGRIEITPAGDGDFYDAGTQIVLRPSANGSGRFLGWTGDAGGADDPVALIVDGQKVVGARFGTPRQIESAGVVNGASFLPTGVSPGQIVTIFGVEIGPDALAEGRVSGGRLETSLAGYRVLFDDVAAPLLYASQNQIAAIAPQSLAGRSDTIVRVSGPGWSSSVRVPVVAAAPALFTTSSSGRGAAAALNQDGTVNSEQNPAPRGSVVVLYATGGGQMSPSAADGSIISLASLPRPILPLEVRIGSRSAVVHYAGGAPGLVSGVMQINVQIPDDGPSGALPVAVRVGSASSPGVVSVFVR